MLVEHSATMFPPWPTPRSPGGFLQSPGGYPFPVRYPIPVIVKIKLVACSFLFSIRERTPYCCILHSAIEVVIGRFKNVRTVHIINNAGMQFASIPLLVRQHCDWINLPMSSVDMNFLVAIHSVQNCPYSVLCCSPACPVLLPPPACTALPPASIVLPGYLCSAVQRTTRSPRRWRSPRRTR